jgi:hypothetical protein
MVAATALVAVFATGASATVFCKSSPLNHVCPAEDNYGVNTPVEGSAKEVHLAINQGGALNVTCGHMSFKGAVSKTGGEFSYAFVLMSEWTFSECTSNCKIETKSSDLAVNWISGSNNGSAERRGYIYVSCYGLPPCAYAGPAGPETGSLTGGSPAALKNEELYLTNTESSFFCPENRSLKLTAESEITTPKPLFVEQK